MFPKSWESCLAAAKVDAEIIEADFQQYYHLEFDPLFRQNFPRYCRLLLQLPFESRFIQKYCPSKDWDWNKEIQSHILHQLDIISCQLANMAKKPGCAPAKPQDLLQPDYVKRAKNEAEKRAREEQRLSAADFEEIKRFWQKYNSKTGRPES